MATEMDPELYKLRHSMAHVLAQSVVALRPQASLGIGPPIDTGFYYDFHLSEPLTPEDFSLIEKGMKKIIKEGQEFLCEEVAGDEAVNRLERDKQNLKIELCKEFSAAGEKITFYKNGPFEDLCEGPHVESTKDLKGVAFKVDSLAGAYWRGDEKREMMQRVYCLCFATKDDLKGYQEKRRLAMERDHRKLNKDLEYFHISDEVGQGLPLWKPNGAVIRSELQKFISAQLFKQGYKQVFTPAIGKLDLYRTSGHFPYYQESQYPPVILREQLEKMAAEGCSCADLSNRLREGELEGYLLKPMNWPCSTSTTPISTISFSLAERPVVSKSITAKRTSDTGNKATGPNSSVDKEIPFREAFSSPVWGGVIKNLLYQNHLGIEENLQDGRT